MSLFADPNLLSPEFIASLTDEQLLTNLEAFKVTAEETYGTDVYPTTLKNFENLYSEAERRNLVSSNPIIKPIQKASLTKPYLPYIIYGGSLLSVIIFIIYYKNKKKRGRKK